MSKNCKKPRTRAKPAATIPPFLHKIYEILENPTYSGLASWNPEGDAFMIRNVTEFTENVLPTYFKHKNFASFVRQLNLYGFHKSRYENNGSEFHHKLFKRGEKHLLTEIKRKSANDEYSDATSPFASIQEEVEPERAVQVPFISPNSLQDIIARQERMENAMKMFYTENKRLSKDNKLLWSEVIKLKTKQSNMEKASRVINEQNTQLLNENRRVWSEMVMTKDKYERQMEKLVLFLISIFSYSGKTPLAMLQKKNNRGTNLNTSTEEDTQHEVPPPQDGDNNALSLIPISKANKNYPRKNKSRIDSLFERLEKESKNNFYATIFEENDFSSKLASLFESTDTGKQQLSSLEYLADKRSAPLDYSFEGADKTSSKFCNRDDGHWDTTGLLTNENINPINKYPFVKPPTMEEITEDMNGVGLGSPINFEANTSFDIAPLKGETNADFANNIGLFSRFNDCPDEEDFESDEGDREEEKNELLAGNNNYFGNNQTEAPLNFLDRMDSSKFEDNAPWMSPTNFLRRTSNMSDLGQNRFFTPSKNNSGLDLSM